MAGQHIIRMISAYGVQISHGRMRYPLAGKHVIKMHAAYSGGTPTVWDGTSSATNLATSFNVISNNIFGAADSAIDWAVAVDPQNNSGSQTEGVTDVIIENNQFYRNRSGGPKRNAPA